jgi:REP element-mobilizing transposase RayT
MDQLDQEKLQKAPPFSTFQPREVKKVEYPDDNQDILLEYTHLESYNLSYTCLLIPRFPSHQLKGDLADLLPQWLQQVCVSFGWGLEFVNVRPDYFQWSVLVTPATSPGYFMQKIRYETSKMILSNFGRIKRENLSNDFWAPSYLVVLGKRPHPEEMIYQYIRTARSQQGLNTL